jgi:universal stress protein A
VPWRVEAGNVKAEIVRCAREGSFDLIVIGSRERHGLSILVNLTEDTVLHAAPCDVLAVRLPPSKGGA